ncbi:MAG: hypothetical protein AAGH99_15755 [Planctomycetota bacterium]
MTNFPASLPEDAHTATDQPNEKGPNVLPRIIVVGAHVLLFGLAIAVAWTTQGRDPGVIAEASTVSPVSEPVMAAVPEAVPNPPKPAINLTEPAERVVPHVVARPAPPVEVVAISETPAIPSPAESVTTEPIAAPQVAMLTPKPAPSAAVEPFNPMVAIPQPDAAFPPELPAAPEDAPHYTHGGLYGTPGATRLVYIIDASGSLIDTLPFIKQELQRAISDLQPEQSFAVLFFTGDGVVEASPVGMKKATSRAVRHTHEWIEPTSARVIANGRPNASAAIRRALAYQPDAIILLSDGLTGRGEKALARRAELLSLIGTANTKDVVFHTLQVRRPDPLSSPTRLGTLELIAMQSGGVHRYFSEDDLLPQ